MTTARAEELAFYWNGNVAVTIHADGSLIREWEGEPRPEHPCSIDLKITDYCDAGCPFCHESSTKRGRHANASRTTEIVESLPSGVEIAIGGGNPLSHPELHALLSVMKSRGLIANLTVFWEHAVGAASQLHGLQRDGLVYGIGISVGDCHPDLIDQLLVQEQNGDEMRLKNVVYHLIAGIHSPWHLLSPKEGRFLVLGYKQYGRGVRHFSPEIEQRLKVWRYFLPGVLANAHLVSFDNLAIERLGVRAIVSPEAWQRGYMGDDGSFTMYVDAVRDEFAVSSTSPRMPLARMTAREAFQVLRAKRGAP